jgi:ABC-type oligopeptide transport system ATPase subunit
MTATLLEATKLAKFYPVKGGARGAQLHAVDEVDLVIGAGESVGLVGESGCGKSTMVRLLARLVDPTSGTIALSGRDITDASQARFTRSPDRARIQVVFQDPTRASIRLSASFALSRIR